MNDKNGRDKILKTAVKVFAQKGFEGARMDEIAKEANVPKSLIYYHFKSKDDLLNVLMDNFIYEYIRILEQIPEESNQEKADNIIGRMRKEYYEFGQNNADLIRVIFMDSLKKSTDKPVFYKVLDAFIEQESKGKDNYNIQERRVAEFFTSFIPTFAYLCFAESWCNYYDMDENTYGELFIKVYEETHGAYHKNL